MKKRNDFSLLSFKAASFTSLHLTGTVLRYGYSLWVLYFFDVFEKHATNLYILIKTTSLPKIKIYLTQKRCAIWPLLHVHLIFLPKYHKRISEESPQTHHADKI